MSTFGLDGVLSWPQARRVAATAARPLRPAYARLDEAVGCVLGEPLLTLLDDPAQDAADVAGYAVTGEGPWIVDESADVLTPGHAVAVAHREPLPRHTDAVLPDHQCHVTERASGGLILVARDRLTDMPDEQVRPQIGSHILRQAAITSAGHELVARDRIVTPAMVASAAAAGHDEMLVVPPPVVGVLVLGGRLLDRGLPRDGRRRDALGDAIPALVGGLGARGNPAVRAPDTAQLLLREIDDAQVDVLVTTGSTAPEPGNYLREVLRDLGARWLVDGVSVTPGAQMLLARLSDGRHLVGLPGDPASAFAAAVTLLPPLIAVLRGEEANGTRRTAVLMEDAPLADYADDTGLAPVRLDISATATLATPTPAGGPGGLNAWSTADAVAIIPPGIGHRGDVVEILDAFGRDAPPAAQ